MKTALRVLALIALAFAGPPLFAKIPLVATNPTQHTLLIDGQPIAVWSQLVAQPTRSILLIHGRTWSALPDFDLTVPGENRSVIKALTAHGYVVYAIDLRGYGSTPRNADGWLTPNQAASDVAAVLTWIAQRDRNIGKPTLLGWSNGALVAQLTAQQHPELISDLILYGYPRDPDNPAPIVPTPEQPVHEANTRENAISDFISPQVASQKLIDAYAVAALKADPIRADWKQLEEFHALDAAKVKAPTLVIHGNRDPLAPITSQAKLFVRLANPDKQWVILAGGDHAAMLEDTHEAFIAAICAFLERPKLKR